jgi:hypothetical protein
VRQLQLGFDAAGQSDAQGMCEVPCGVDNGGNDVGRIGRREIPAGGGGEAMIDERDADEVVVARLHEVQEAACDGQDTAALWLGVLERIDKHEPGILRDQMIRQFAVEVAEIRLCRFCWRPLEILLRMLLVPPRVQ